MMRKQSGSWWWSSGWVILLVGVVRADFGDYAEDVSNGCPLITSCPKVCVSNMNDCLTACPDDAPVLCPDGHCRIECNHPYHFINPCETSCAGAAAAASGTSTLMTCPKVDDYYESCTYQTIPNNAISCDETTNTSNSSSRPITKTEQAILWTLVFWIMGITVAIMWFSRSNYHHHSQPSASASASSSYDQQVVLLGYQHSRLGNLLYVLTVLTFMGIQAILLVLVILYYVEQMSSSSSSTGIISKFQSVLPWNDEHRILFTFEMVWMIGFVWSLWISWPARLKSIFRRPCHSIADADIVAVWTPNIATSTNTGGMIHSDACVTWFRAMVSRIHARVHAGVSRTFYSIHDPRRRYETTGGGQWNECPVITDPSHHGSGTKYFVHNFRRHIITGTTNHHDDTMESEQSIHSFFQNNKNNNGLHHAIPLPQTMQEYANYYNNNNSSDNPNVVVGGGGGLKDSQVNERLRIVGPNLIEMRPPSFLRVIKEEFTRTYYIYQK